MGRRAEWRKVLDAETRCWSAKSAEQLEADLRSLQVYEIEFDSKKYQVEVQLLEDTPKYVHVLISVDDGSLPSSLAPLTESFIIEKPAGTHAAD